MDMKELGEAGQFLRLTNLEQLAAKAQAFDGTQTYFYTKQPLCVSLQMCLDAKLTVFFSGTKRVWMPDDVEAYTEVEIRELNGDKTTVETKDGRVGKLVVDFTLSR